MLLHIPVGIYFLVDRCLLHTGVRNGVSAHPKPAVTVKALIAGVLIRIHKLVKLEKQMG